MARYMKLHNTIWTNPKFLGLKSDVARLAYIRVLSLAKETDPEGEWMDRSYLDAQAGQYAPWIVPYLDELFETKLLTTLDDGSVVIRQWKFWQAWDGKRPASQLEIEAPLLLAQKQASDRERKRRQRERERARAAQAPATEAGADPDAASLKDAMASAGGWAASIVK